MKVTIRHMAAYVTPGSAAPYLSTEKLVPLAVTGHERFGRVIREFGIHSDWEGRP